MGFFSQAMNQLTGDAKYMDEFERALYNNVLAGVAASGRQYTYQNPLNTDRSERWEWHPCPCCPPMFLKIVSATPEFIYARDDKTVYVNLFIGSDADIALGDTQVHVRQQTRYPVDGKVVLTLTPEKAARFTVKVRIPGWARGEENPFGLYVSESPAAPVLSVNGTPVEIRLDKGTPSSTGSGTPQTASCWNFPSRRASSGHIKPPGNWTAWPPSRPGRWYTASSRRTTRITPG